MSLLAVGNGAEGCERWRFCGCAVVIGDKGEIEDECGYTDGWDEGEADAVNLYVLMLIYEGECLFIYWKERMW